jgi:hypothetical protein
VKGIEEPNGQISPTGCKVILIRYFNVVLFILNHRQTGKNSVLSSCS